jgi:hypothetical protein
LSPASTSGAARSRRSETRVTFRIAESPCHSRQRCRAGARLDPNVVICHALRIRCIAHAQLASARRLAERAPHERAQPTSASASLRSGDKP